MTLREKLTRRNHLPFHLWHKNLWRSFGAYGWRVIARLDCCRGFHRLAFEGGIVRKLLRHSRLNSFHALTPSYSGQNPLQSIPPSHADTY